MKGRAPTKDEKEFMNLMAEVGCIACRKEGNLNSNISIHHMDGRIKEGCHYKVLPLCGNHHQIPDTFSPPRWGTIHNNKRIFEERYGTEIDLYHECIEIMKEITIRRKNER